MTHAEWQQMLDDSKYVGCFNVLDLDFRPQGDVIPEGDNHDGDIPRKEDSGD